MGTQKVLLLLSVAAALCGMAAAITTQLEVRRVPTNVHVSPLKLKLKAWHEKVSKAFNTDPAYMDMMLGLFVANVTVGTPPQPFLMGLDTGSADFWVIDSSCSSQTCLGEPKSGYTKKRFDESKSTTFINNNTQVSIQYVTGVCYGTLGQDTLTFGQITDRNQPLGVMTVLDDDLGYMPSDGIFGVAWPSVSSFGVEPPLNRIVGQLDKPLFSVWLGKHPSVSATYNGIITYGALDSANCDSDWNFVPLQGDSFWVYHMDSFTLGGSAIAHSEDVTADTGTSWINVPNRVVDRIVSATNADYDFQNDMYLVNCDAKALPTWVFRFGGRDYPLTSADYLLPLGTGRCAVKIYAQDMIGGWLVGDTFMRPYCHAYDIGNRRMGLAKSTR